jgi:hypothetical protein
MEPAGPANRKHGVTFKVVGTAYLLFILIGIILNRSLAAALIAVPFRSQASRSCRSS